MILQPAPGPFWEENGVAASYHLLILRLQSLLWGVVRKSAWCSLALLPLPGADWRSHWFLTSPSCSPDQGGNLTPLSLTPISLTPLSCSSDQSRELTQDGLPHSSNLFLDWSGRGLEQTLPSTAYPGQDQSGLEKAQQGGTCRLNTCSAPYPGKIRAVEMF